MFKETQELIKKFELEQHANVEPVLEPAYWTVTVWMPLKGSPTPEKSKSTGRALGEAIHHHTGIEGMGNCGEKPDL